MNRRSKERVILDATPIRDVAYTLDDALIASATGLARQDNGSWIVTGPDPGILQTVPLHGSGDHLLVRASLANTSDLRVALLGVDGCVMENFDDDTTTMKIPNNIKDSGNLRTCSVKTSGYRGSHPDNS